MHFAVENRDHVTHCNIQSCTIDWSIKVIASDNEPKIEKKRIRKEALTLNTTQYCGCEDCGNDDFGTASNDKINSLKSWLPSSLNSEIRTAVQVHVGFIVFTILASGLSSARSKLGPFLVTYLCKDLQHLSRLFYSSHLSWKNERGVVPKLRELTQLLLVLLHVTRCYKTYSIEGRPHTHTHTHSVKHERQIMLSN